MNAFHSAPLIGCATLHSTSGEWPDARGDRDAVPAGARRKHPRSARGAGVRATRVCFATCRWQATPRTCAQWPWLAGRDCLLSKAAGVSYVKCDAGVSFGGLFLFFFPEAN